MDSFKIGGVPVEDFAAFEDDKVFHVTPEVVSEVTPEVPAGGIVAEVPEEDFTAFEDDKVFHVTPEVVSEVTPEVPAGGIVAEVHEVLDAGLAPEVAAEVAAEPPAAPQLAPAAVRSIYLRIPSSSPALFSEDIAAIMNSYYPNSVDRVTILESHLKGNEWKAKSALLVVNEEGMVQRVLDGGIGRSPGTYTMDGMTVWASSRYLM